MTNTKRSQRKQKKKGRENPDQKVCVFHIEYIIVYRTYIVFKFLQNYVFKKKKKKCTTAAHLKSQSSFDLPLKCSIICILKTVFQK